MPKLVRVLYAWELGDNRGHLDRGIALARELRTRGHPVLFSVRNTALAIDSLGSSGFHYLQSPIHLRRRPFNRGICSYADILLASGYDDPNDLAGLMKAWATTIALFGADVVVADHAPTAILAAKTMGIPIIALGTGFEIPPFSYPYLGFKKNCAFETLKASHDELNASIHAALCKTGRKLWVAEDIFAGVQTFLTTFRALDHYSDRISGEYVGPIHTAYRKPEVAWPAPNRRRIFIYLHNGSAFVDTILDAVERIGATAICVSPNFMLKKPHQHVIALRESVDLTQILKTADLVISNGGAGLIAQCAEVGVPMLLCPGFSEQQIGAQRATEAGLARVIDGGALPKRIELDRMILGEQADKHAAIQFSKTIGTNSLRRAVLIIAQAIEKLGTQKYLSAFDTSGAVR